MAKLTAAEFTKLTCKGCGKPFCADLPHLPNSTFVTGGLVEFDEGGETHYYHGYINFSAMEKSSGCIGEYLRNGNKSSLK